MVQVRKCCCFELRTGTLVIVTLGWIFTLMKIFVFIAAVIDEHDNEESDTERTLKFFGVSSSERKSVLAYRLTCGIVSFIGCVLLIVGVCKRVALYFIPYLIYSCLECIGVSILTVVIFVSIFALPKGVFLVTILMFFLLLFSSVISWYFWLVVYSYYHVVKNGGTPSSTGGKVYYVPTSTQPPPYEKDSAEIA